MLLVLGVLVYSWVVFGFVGDFGVKVEDIWDLESFKEVWGFYVFCFGFGYVYGYM